MAIFNSKLLNYQRVVADLGENMIKLRKSVSKIWIMSIRKFDIRRS